MASALRELGGKAIVCERILQAIAYLCRYSEENKASVCLENAKGFGIAGVCELVVGAIKRHGEDKRFKKIFLRMWCSIWIMYVCMYVWMYVCMLCMYVSYVCYVCNVCYVCYVC